MMINEVEIEGTVVPGSYKKEYNEEYKWYDIEFQLNDVHCCNTPVDCYIGCEDKPDEDLKDNEKVLIGGVLCIYRYDKLSWSKIQVHRIIHETKGAWER